MTRQLATVLILLALSACGHTPGEIAAGTAEFVFEQKAKHNYVDACRTRRGDDATCNQEFEDIQSEGQALYREQKEAEGGQHPKEMAEELEEFVTEKQNERSESP